MIEFLRENAGWLFGSGGAVAAVLAVYKAVFAAKKPDNPKPAGTGHAGTPSTGSALNLAIFAAALVAVVGLAFMFTGPTVNTASDAAASISGDNNQVTIRKD